MRYYDESEYEPRNTKAKKLKHSRNRPGQGMKVISSYYDDDDYDYEVDLEKEDDTVSLRHRSK